MHHITLISFDAKLAQRCSAKLAQQLLHLGLATIIKIYPYTLQLKGKPFHPDDPFLEVQPSPNPKINPPMRRLMLYPAKSIFLEDKV